MLAFVQRRFAGGGWSPGKHQPYRQLSLRVKSGDAFGPMKAFKEVRQFAKKHGIIQMTFRSSFYEPPTSRRMRESSERAYFAKWNYLKYCTRVVDYSMHNSLLMRTPVAEGGSNRLAQICSQDPIQPKVDGMHADEIRNMAESFYGKLS